MKDLRHMIGIKIDSLLSYEYVRYKDKYIRMFTKVRLYVNSLVEAARGEITKIQY